MCCAMPQMGLKERQVRQSWIRKVGALDFKEGRKEKKNKQMNGKTLPWSDSTRATSHTSHELWHCNGEDPWLSFKGRTMGVGKAVLGGHGPSSMVRSENGPCCGTIAYFVGGKKHGGCSSIQYVSNSINLREFVCHAICHEIYYKICYRICP